MVAPRDQPEDDERDIFPPPAIPTEVSCLHCGQVYDSYRIEWRTDAGPPGDSGAWCCPTPGCDGLGFLFDIWPTDPDWRDEEGNKVCFFGEDEDDDEEEEEEEFDAAEQDWPELLIDPASFDPTWGDPSHDLPPDLPPPRRSREAEPPIDEDDIPF